MDSCARFPEFNPPTDWDIFKSHWNNPSFRPDLFTWFRVSIAYAETVDCGGPPEVADKELSGAIEGQARGMNVGQWLRIVLSVFWNDENHYVTVSETYFVLTLRVEGFEMSNKLFCFLKVRERFCLNLQPSVHGDSLRGTGFNSFRSFRIRW